MSNDFETPAGERLSIIGDIHGCSDLLDKMLEVIHRDIEKHGCRESLTITLGDYVDRGPDSRGVLERLVRNPFPSRYIALKGNHEVLLNHLRATAPTPTYGYGSVVWKHFTPMAFR